MRQGLLIALLLVALGALGWYCVDREVPRIEAELTSEALTALEQAGLPTNVVSFEGVDAWLGESLSREETFEQARILIAAIPGVHTVLKRAAAPLRPSSFSIEVAATGVTIRGVLPDATTHGSVLQTSQVLFGPDVLDSVAVDPERAPPQWMDSLPTILGLVRDRLTDGGLSIDGASVAVGGAAQSENNRAELGERLKSMFPNHTVQNNVVARRGESQVESEIERLMAGRTIEFTSSSSEITDRGASILDEIAAVLEDHPEVRILIEGHTDITGDQDLNLGLSSNRADAVREYLIARGVSATRLQATGFGAERPIAPNSTPEGRLANRRIEFHVVGGN